jgi:hypothetical protein
MKPGKIALLLTLVTTLTLSACSFSRPSVDEVAKALSSTNAVVPVPAGQANCVATVLVDSDLSDDTLKAIVTADTKYKGSTTEQNKLSETLTTAQKACNK